MKDIVTSYPPHGIFAAQCGLNYEWFEVDGHSMTNWLSDSIPHGSKVLGRRLINLDKSIPTNKPMVIIWEEEGEGFACIKIVSFVNPLSGAIHCRSLSPDSGLQPFCFGLKLCH